VKYVICYWLSYYIIWNSKLSFNYFGENFFLYLHIFLLYSINKMKSKNCPCLIPFSFPTNYIFILSSTSIPYSSSISISISSTSSSSTSKISTDYTIRNLIHMDMDYTIRNLTETAQYEKFINCTLKITLNQRQKWELQYLWRYKTQFPYFKLN